MESGITDGYEFNCFGFEWSESQILVVSVADDVFLNKLEAFDSKSQDDLGGGEVICHCCVDWGCIAWVGI